MNTYFPITTNHTDCCTLLNKRVVRYNLYPQWSENTYVVCIIKTSIRITCARQLRVPQTNISHHCAVKLPHIVGFDQMQSLMKLNQSCHHSSCWHQICVFAIVHCFSLVMQLSYSAHFHSNFNLTCFYPNIFNIEKWIAVCVPPLYQLQWRED